MAMATAMATATAMSERKREEESSLGGYEHAFLRAADALKDAGLKKEVYISDAQKIKLYALYKQAIEGDCSKPQPSAFQPVERAKWNGWQSLRGVSKTMAKRRYVLQVIELLPTFKMDTSTAAAAPMAEEESVAQDAAPATTTLPATGVPVSEAAASAQRQEPPRAICRTTRPSRATGGGHHTIQPHGKPEALPYIMVMLELVALALGAAIVVVVISRAQPLCRQLLAQQSLGVETCQTLKSLTPAMWFLAGYALVRVLRRRLFAWRVLAGDFVWVTSVPPRVVTQRLQPRHREEPVPAVIEELGLTLVRDPIDESDARTLPALEITYGDNSDATSFGIATQAYPFPVEQTMDMHYRRYKEPLPDPTNPLLLEILVLEERVLDEWDAVFKRRLLRFRNAAPYLIKRFASSDYVDYIEVSLFDKRNRIFYVYTRNQTFPGLGSLEDYMKYEPSGPTNAHTLLTQTGRVHITNSSVGFFRGKIEKLVSDFYLKKIPAARQYLHQRLDEEYGVSVAREAPSN